MTPRIISPKQAEAYLTDWIVDLSYDIEKSDGEVKFLLQHQAKNLQIAFDIVKSATEDTIYFIDASADYTANPDTRIIFTLVGMSYNDMPPEYRDEHWFYNSAGENKCWMFVPLHHNSGTASLNTEASQKRVIDEYNEGITEICRDCGKPFVILIGEQLYMKSRNLAMPRRCKACRASRKCTFGA